MKRFRHFFTRAAVLSSLVCVAALGLWARSYTRQYAIARANNHRTAFVGVIRGTFIGGEETDERPAGWYFFSDPISPSSLWMQTALGFFAKWEPGAHILGIPLWGIALLAAGPPVGWLLSWRMRKKPAGRASARGAATICGAAPTAAPSAGWRPRPAQPLDCRRRTTSDRRPMPARPRHNRPRASPAKTPTGVDYVR